MAAQGGSGPTIVQIPPPTYRGWINTSNLWASNSSSYSRKIPLTIGKTYTLSFVTTDSSQVGAVFRIGQTNSTEGPSNQKLFNVTKTTPQQNQTLVTVASYDYLILQISNNVGDNIINNNLLIVTMS